MDHHRHSPSSFPMRAKCAQYESGSVGPAAEHGTAMHDVFATMFGEKLALFRESVTLDDQEKLKWAKEQVELRVNSEYPVEIEVKLSYTDPKFKELYFGHGDVVNGPQLFDLKTGEQHAYWHQMAGYALALMDTKGYDQVDIHLLYSRFATVKSYTITKEQAEPAINDILVRVDDPDAPFSPNEFCGWCGKRATCPALAERVDAIAVQQNWALESYSLDDIAKKPTELAKAIHLAKLMMKWSYAVQDMAKGQEVPGFKWKEIRGRRSIKDALAAFKRAGLPEEAFLRACSVSLSSLERAFRDSLGLSAKEAKEMIELKLSEIIEESKPYQKLEEEK